MKQVTYSEVVPHNRYKVTQEFRSGTVINIEGECLYKADNYLAFADTGFVNVHPHVGMPNVYIWEFKSGADV